MLNVTSFELNRPSLPRGNGQISELFSFTTGTNVLVINSLENVLIKKIEIAGTFSITSVTIADTYLSYFDLRFLLTNRDGVILRGYAGDILNPVSGPFDGSLLKRTDIDISSNSFKNFIEFPDGVLAAGLIPISYSAQYSMPTATSANLRFVINIFY